jgi:nucleotide-binding universal stress UspA family protein
MYETILVPTDGSAGAEAALDEAVSLAETFDATVHSLYVADTSTAQPETGYVDIVESFERIGEETTAEAVGRAEAANVHGVGAVRTGLPHRAILDYAEEVDADLVVMGTHGRTGLERYLLGSVTEKVVRTADAPVLTVRAPDEDETDSEDGASDGDAAADGTEGSDAGGEEN